MSDIDVFEFHEAFAVSSLTSDGKETVQAFAFLGDCPLNLSGNSAVCICFPGADNGKFEGYGL